MATCTALVKVLYIARRRPGMLHSEYVQFNAEVHGAKTRDHPVAIRKYVQNYICDSSFGTGKDPSYCIPLVADGISELYFDDLNGITQTYTDERTIAGALADGPMYVDGRTVSALVLQEEEVPVSHRGSQGLLKVMHVMKPRDGHDAADLVHEWHSSHNVSVERSGIGAYIRRVVLSFPARNAADVAGPLASPGSRFGLVASYWFDLVHSGASYFRRYYDTLISGGLGSIDHSRSFFAHVEEVILFDVTRGNWIVAGTPASKVRRIAEMAN